MSHNSDLEFVDQLRNMAAATPKIAMPGAETIVRAGRSRVARRRSVLSGAFGVALLASAGFATMPHTGVVGTHPGAIAPAAISTLHQPMEPAIAPLETRIQPTDITLPDDAVIEAAGNESPLNISPLATGLGIAGAASIGTAAGLALKSRRLQPIPARANRSQ